MKNLLGITLLLLLVPGIQAMNTTMESDVSENNPLLTGAEVVKGNSRICELLIKEEARRRAEGEISLVELANLGNAAKKCELKSEPNL